jgi:hypothetical protein
MIEIKQLRLVSAHLRAAQPHP